MKSSKLKVLVTAHEISPFQGSECKSGWNILKELSYLHDLVIVSPDTNQFNTSAYKENIMKCIDEFHETAEFIFIPQPFNTRFISKINKLFFGKSSNIGNQLLYFVGVKFWEKSVKNYLTSKKMLEKIDVIHHFNHITFREPGFLYSQEIPFFWGPTSGIADVPEKYVENFPIRRALKYKFRNILNTLQKRSNRIVKAAKMSNTIFCVTYEDYEFFSKYSRNVIPLNDMGVTYEHQISSKKIDLSKTKLKLLWIGRIDELKCLNLLIESVAKSKLIQDNVEVTVIGDGPLLEESKTLAKEAQVFEIFNFIGKIRHEEVNRHLLQNHLLVHTSIKEAGSSVILEAISTNTPFLSHDAFGMKFLIKNGLGFGVKLNDPHQSIDGFKKQIEKIINNQDLINEKSSYINDFKDKLSWSASAKIIANAYEKAR